MAAPAVLGGCQPVNASRTPQLCSELAMGPRGTSVRSVGPTGLAGGALLKIGRWCRDFLHTIHNADESI